MSLAARRLLAALAASVAALGALPAYAEDPPHAREAPEDTAPVPPTSQDAAPPTAPATPPSDSAPPPPPAALPQAKKPIPMGDEKLVFVRSPRMDRLLSRGVTWDANLEGGVGAVFAHPVDSIAFARARAGVTLVRDPLLETLGITYEYSGPATFGLLADVSLLETGFWGQIGAMMDVKGHAGGMLAFGWALVGVEGEYRGAESMDPAWAIYGKLRIPVSILIRGLGQ